MQRLNREESQVSVAEKMNGNGVRRKRFLRVHLRKNRFDDFGHKTESFFENAIHDTDPDIWTSRRTGKTQKETAD
jgi:hypothetical protein